MPSRFSLTSVAPAGAVKSDRRRERQDLLVEVEPDDAVGEQLAAEDHRYRSADRFLDGVEVDHRDAHPAELEIADFDRDVLDELGLLG